MKIEITKKQAEDIQRFYDLIHSDLGVIEAFFLSPDGKKKTRFYDDKKTFLNEVAVFNSKGFTCYAGIQPRKKELMKNGKSGDNDDVISLRLLYMDLDPVRPKGKNSTDEEKAVCQKIAENISNQISNGHGFHKPVMTDSGNGNWLLFEIPEIEITDENRAEIQERLKIWGRKAAERFKTDGIDIDSVWDLRRVTKIPGTKIFNKPDEADRPQRISGIISDSFPGPDQRMKNSFLSVPVEVKEGPKNEIKHDLNVDRVFARCYLMSFLKGKGTEGTNIPHKIRLGLSTLSIPLGDLQNDLYFIRQILGGCPDFSEDQTRYYLKQNQDKAVPWGCEALKETVVEHFNDFDESKCSCRLTPSINPETGEPRKPSPIRFAYLLEEDLEDIFKDFSFTDDTFSNIVQLRDFTKDALTQFDTHVGRAFLKSKKDQTKIVEKDITELLKYRDQVIKETKKEKNTVKLTKAEIDAAIELLKRPGLLYEYGQFIGQLGVVGEEKNVRIILLALTSRLLDTLISLILKAESSTGKSYILKNCLRVMPEESFFEYSAMSNRAMIYTNKDFRHKFIIFYEFDGQNDDVNYLIRTLQSEGRLKYEYTAKVDGDFETHSIDKEGPTGFITTTTKSQIFDENETRIFSLYLNETEAQTKEIIKRMGSRFLNEGVEVPDEELKKWKNVQRVLKPYKVKIPFASWLSERIPTNRVRIRRDFERVLLSISVCTLLHQYQRKHVEEHGQKYVVASVADYYMIRELLEGTLIKTISGVANKTDQIIQAVKEIYFEKVTGTSDNTKEEDTLVSLTDLINRTGNSERSIRNWIKPAIEFGYVERTKIGKFVYFKPGNTPEENRKSVISSFLPRADDLIEAFPEQSKGLKFVDPVTGEEMSIEEEE